MCLVIGEQDSGKAEGGHMFSVGKKLKLIYA